MDLYIVYRVQNEQRELLEMFASELAAFSYAFDCEQAETNKEQIKYLMEFSPAEQAHQGPDNDRLTLSQTI